MQATLNFQLPEETDEHFQAVNGAKAFCCLDDLDNHLRGILKYQERPVEEAKIYQEIRDKLRELRSEWEI